MTAQSTTETIAVGGLNAPAEIAIHCWGIPHLQASTRDDLFFVQGFNAARDRLWQIDGASADWACSPPTSGLVILLRITLRVSSFIAATWQPSGREAPSTQPYGADRCESDSSMKTPLLDLTTTLARSVPGEPIAPDDLKRLEAFRTAAGTFVKGIGGRGEIQEAWRALPPPCSTGP